MAQAGKISILECLVFQRHLIPRLRYVGRIVFESDISLRRIRRVEFRGNLNKEYYRSVVRPPYQPSPRVFCLHLSFSPSSLSPSLFLSLFLVHRRGFFLFTLRSFLLLYVPAIETHYFNRLQILYIYRS